MRRRTLTAALAAALVAAAGATATAQAADGWHVAQRHAETSSLVTYVSVYGDGLAARLTIRANSGNRIKTSGHVSCWTADYSRTVARDVTPSSRRAAGISRPIVRSFAPTFAGAHACAFMLTAIGGGGTLRATLEVRP